MSINQKLDLRQGQTLTMTPQLQQAIKLLQMSNLELSAFIETELEKNPLLEHDEGQNKSDPSVDKDTKLDIENRDTQNHLDDSDRRAGERELDTDFENVFTGNSQSDHMASHEGGYDAFATNSFSDVGKGGSSKFENNEFSFENTLAEEKSLREHLVDQISLEIKDTKETAVATILLDYLDEAGYLRTDLNALADRLGCGIDLIETVLDKLQQMDPPGIFARDLSECLALQLREKNHLDPAIQALLDNLDLLAKHDFKTLKDICGVDEDDLKDMILEIKTLDPKPALKFEHFVSQTVIPDVLMKPLPKDKGGGWAVELNNDTLPRVLVNQTYYTEITKNTVTKKDKEYINEQLATANWLIRAMDQRADTILKTSSEIIKQQEAFFLYGVEFMKPLILKDIAEEIGMHESTISRVTSGKYIGTPRGVFELKYFFSSGISATTGATSYSSEAVKARIKSLVDSEDPKKILSDDTLVDLLQKEGIDIARRTVAKYREALNIPSSVQRRRQKKMS